MGFVSSGNIDFSCESVDYSDIGESDFCSRNDVDSFLTTVVGFTDRRGLEEVEESESQNGNENESEVLHLRILV